MSSKTRRPRIPLSQKLEERLRVAKEVNRDQVATWVRQVEAGTLPPGRYVQEWITRNWRYIFVCPPCIALSGIIAEIGSPFKSRDGNTVLHPPLCGECYCGIRLVRSGPERRYLDEGEDVPRALWSREDSNQVPSTVEIAVAKEAKDWEVAVQLLGSRLDAEEEHSAIVRKIYGDGPLANPDHYESLAVILRKLGDRVGEMQVVDRFRAQPHEGTTKRVQALLQRA